MTRDWTQVFRTIGEHSTHKTNELCTSNFCVWFGWVGFYGISTIVGYLMWNSLYTYILNIYDVVWFGLVAYQPL